jgi:outer membrane protein assembly factor BamB
LNATNLHRDQFGLQKLVVAAAKNGKVFALDSSNGEIVWSTSLGLTRHSGPELDVQGMWIVREVGDGVNPTLAIIASRTVDGVGDCASQSFQY